MSLLAGLGQFHASSVVLVQAWLNTRGPFCCCVGGREPGHVYGALRTSKGKEICLALVSGKV